MFATCQVLLNNRSGSTIILQVLETRVEDSGVVLRSRDGYQSLKDTRSQPQTLRSVRLTAAKLCQKFNKLELRQVIYSWAIYCTSDLHQASIKDMADVK